MKVTKYILNENRDKTWTLLIFFKNKFETMAPMSFEAAVKLMKKLTIKK